MSGSVAELVVELAEFMRRGEAIAGALGLSSALAVAIDRVAGKEKSSPELSLAMTHLDELVGALTAAHSVEIRKMNAAMSRIRGNA